MAFRRNAVIARPGKKIDNKEWTFLAGQTQDVTADSTFIAQGFLNFAIPGTILRCRGNFLVSMLIGGLTADDQTQVGFGLALLSTDAVAAGAGSLPDPLGEPGFPWLWWSDTTVYTINADVAEAAVSQRVVVDTKAMRKFKPGQTLVMVGQYGNITGIPGVTCTMGRIRVLIGT